MATQSEAERDREVDALEKQLAGLMEDVDRYRTACEDTLQQLDWCIGYFTGSNKRGLAKALSANRASIRRHLLHRPAMPSPTMNEEEA
jgi:hypothetical protein